MRINGYGQRTIFGAPLANASSGTIHKQKTHLRKWKQILEMLAAGKVNATKAEDLLAALDSSPSATVADPATKPKLKYLRVLVDALDKKHDTPTKVNVRIPMQLLRVGVRFAGLIPAHLNHAMKERGIPFDISLIKPENLDKIIEQLNDLTVHGDEKHDNVQGRVFCE